MLKKYGLGLLVAVIIIQLCVPFGMIISSFATSSRAEKYGTEYKIPLDSISLDGENGFLFYNVYHFEPYISVTEGEDGFAVLTPVYEKPEGSSYIKNKKIGYDYHQFPADRFHVGRLKHIDKLWLVDDRNDDEWWYERNVAYYSEAYFQAYVYNGKISVKDVFIDGIPAKQFIARFDVQED